MKTSELRHIIREEIRRMIGEELPRYVPPKLKGKNAGDVWQIQKPSTNNKFGAMNQVNLVRYFKTRKEAEEWSTGEHPASYSGW